MNKAYTNWLLGIGATNLVILLITLLTSVFTSSPLTAVLWFFVPAITYFVCTFWNNIREDPTVVRFCLRDELAVFSRRLHSRSRLFSHVLFALLLLLDAEHGRSSPASPLHRRRSSIRSSLGVGDLPVRGGRSIHHRELPDGDGEQEVLALLEAQQTEDLRRRCDSSDRAHACDGDFGLLRDERPYLQRGC